MNYHVVFDIAQQPYAWWWPALGLLFFVFASIRWEPVIYGSTASFSRRVWIIIGTLWITFFASLAGLDYYSNQEVMRLKTYLVVEGKVENFVPMPYSGHG